MNNTIVRSEKVYKRLAGLVAQHLNCIASNNHEWRNRSEIEIEDIISSRFPHGSGFDSGVKLDFDKSHGDRLVFTTSFHHMDENGYYDGWTYHDVIVTPSLYLGYHLRVTGRDKREIKDYIAECFSYSLDTVIEY